jgi:serine/threonine-protein kinase
VVDGRYRLLRPVGSGASAHVYVAEDVRLKRRVALKLLHPALAEDAAFFRRFQAEAHTVASLSHHGIVRVYDWGADSGNAYLTMELLEGGSLRSVLDGGHRFSVSQAAALGLDVASALAYAHARGLVHRDIKPANLLFDQEGHVCVGDFGVARALAEASWTEPLGAMVGTARYAAPEQLKGVPLDGRADVYALALVLVEAVTGQVPFARDTALGALMARAETPVPVPESLGALAPVLRQAGAPQPEDRLTAEAMARAIAGVAGQLRAPAALPLVGLARADTTADGRTEVGSGSRRTGADLSILVDDLVVLPGGRAPEAVAPEVTPPEPESVAPEVTPPVRVAREPAAPEGTTPEVMAPGEVKTGRAHQSGPADLLLPAASREDLGVGPIGERQARGAGKAGRRRWLRRVVLAVLGMMVLAAGATALVLASRPAPTYPAPRLVGLSVARARSETEADHLRVVVVSRQWGTAPAGVVVSQYPPPGSQLKALMAVSVTVSLGPQPVSVPDLATLDLAQARAELRSARLRLGPVQRRTSMTVPSGDVISWSPQNRQVPPGTHIELVMSTGKPMVPVPAVPPGTTSADLVAQLRGAGFVVSELTAYSDAVPSGEVIAVSPVPGDRLVYGSTVTVTSSLGPHLVTVPSAIVGLSVDAASKLLSGLGLYVYEVQGDPLSPVTGSQPAVGSAVLYGKSVVLVTK